MITIREQILQLIKAELAKILISNGYYTNIGLHTIRGRYDVFPSELPAVVLLADQEEAIAFTGRDECEMNITISGFSKYSNSYPEYTDRLAHDAEAILGDIKTCMTSIRFTLDFSSGSIEPRVGMTITGSSSGATSIVESISVASGSWATNDAAGTLSLRLPWQDYTTESLLTPGGGVIASTTGTMTLIPPFSDLLNNIEYRRGGIDPLPDPGEGAMKISANFSVVYVTLAGNPYKQS